jgi:hypothetical protein
VSTYGAARTLIADNLGKAGWGWGCVASVDREALARVGDSSETPRCPCFGARRDRLVLSDGATNEMATLTRPTARGYTATITLRILRRSTGSHFLDVNVVYDAV